MVIDQHTCSLCGGTKPFTEFRRRGQFVEKVCVECKRGGQKERKPLILRPLRGIEPPLSLETGGPLHGIEPSDPLKNIDLEDYSVWEEAAGRALTEDEKPEIKRNLNALASVLDRILTREEKHASR